MKSRTNMKIGHVGSNSSSLGQISNKPCVCSRDQSFGLVLMNLGQSFCLDEIFKFLKMGHVRSKSRSLSEMYVCPLMLYHTIRKAQVSGSRAIMALLFVGTISQYLIGQFQRNLLELFISEQRRSCHALTHFRGKDLLGVLYEHCQI